MVRLLIRLRAAISGHRRSSRFGVAAAVLTGVLGLLSAATSLLAGFADYPAPAIGGAVVSAIVTLWVAGRLGYAAFSGGSGLQPELFRLLPTPRRVLARALLITGLFDGSLLVMAIAFGALVALGAHEGPLPAAVGAVGALATLLLTGATVSVIEALMPPPSRQRQALGTLVVAVVISLVAVGGTLLPALATSLVAGRIPWLALVLEVLPTGWAADAVTAARIDAPIAVLLPLLGLGLLLAAVVALWPRVLSRRLEGMAATSTRRRRMRARLLPATPVGAVVGKELRMWVRDPSRLAFLLIAAIVGLGVCAVPELTHGAAFLLPFAGILFVVIAGGGGCNLYGSDGLALRLTLLTPGGERADVRGRQWAFLLIVGPYAGVATVVLTALSGQGWAWPWSLSLAAAILGGAVGLVPLSSAFAVLPLDSNGGPAPSWPVKVYAVILLELVAAAPAVGLLVVGAVVHSAAVEWTALPVGICTGALAATLLGTAAARRLRANGAAILEQLTGASVRAAA